MTVHLTSRVRPMGAALAAAAVTAVTMWAAPVAVAADTPKVPILGQAVVRPNQSVEGSADTEVVLTVHAIRRVENGTVVYYSAGVKKGSAKMSHGPVVMSMGDVPNLTNPGQPSFRDPSVGIIDSKNQKVYFTYDADDAHCIGCTRIRSDEDVLGVAKVYAATTPRVPDDVKTVTVRVGTALFSNLPVSDGVLPSTAKDDKPTVVGVAWPKVDLSRVPSMDPAKFTAALTGAVVDGTIATRTEESTVSLDLNSAVLFDVDKADVKAEGQAAVAEAVAKVKAAKKDTGALTVTGHTDSDGDDAYNLDLSKRRAEAVAALLRAGLPGAQISAVGKGETEPLASNETDSGKQANRRVTITLGSNG